MPIRGVFRLAHILANSVYFITMTISGIMEGLAPAFLTWETSVVTYMVSA